MRLAIRLCILGLVAGSAWAGDDGQVLVSRTAEAQQFSPEVRTRAADLVEVTRAAADAATVLSALESHAADPALDPVVRDAVVYDYVRRLRDAGPDAAPPEVIAWLKDYRPSAVRIHEESVDARVPLFNVAAAAAGLENQWQFEGARRDLLEADGDALVHHVSRFIRDPDGPQAAGMLAALDAMPAKQLDRLAVQVRAHPEAADSMLYPAVELARGRADRVSEWIAAADRRRVAEILRMAEGKLPAEAAQGIRRAALHHPDPGVRGLAMARITDTLIDADTPERQAWRDELLTRLADPVTGSAAALQLARVAGEEWLALKREQATDPVTERRLALAARLRAGMMGDRP